MVGMAVIFHSTPWPFFVRVGRPPAGESLFMLFFVLGGRNTHYLFFFTVVAA